ncbi:MAG: hypothetical protein H3C31_10515 [Brumimicrobium sp.]|nr:hypothetical protein [Brumimicrobium sp.]
MNKALKIYLIVAVVIVALLTLMQLNKKPILDWRKNYNLKSKAPFGLYVFNQEADNLFNHKLKRSKESPYDFYSKDSLKSAHNILIINKGYDIESRNKILKQVYKGSNALLIGDWVLSDYFDTLRIHIQNFYNDSSTLLSFTDTARNAKINIDKLPNYRGFYMLKDRNHEYLGKVEVKGADSYFSNFVKVSYGKGAFYIHADPMILTNYYLLQVGNEKYVEQVFSYLPHDKHTIWFIDNQVMVDESPMRFILQHPALRYAWYCMLIGMLAFIIFRGKRMQRIIPIVKPLPNTSVEFVKNIGNLYLNEGNVKDMMNKKAAYFLHKVRTDLLLDTSKLNREFEEKLQLKTNATIEDVEEAIQCIRIAQDNHTIVYEKDLIAMNKLLDKIYK